MTQRSWETLKWTGYVLLLLGTLTQLSPRLASTSLTPWILFIIGNIIWCADSVHQKSWPWIFAAISFLIVDVFICVSRVFGLQVFNFIQPLITILEMLP